jgi:HK97 gp10 family phage protein
LSGAIADAAEKALLQGMKRVQADAKRLAPVDTGQLRNSITASVERAPDGDIVGTVGTNAAHAAANEFGSGPVGEASPKILPPGMKINYRKTGWVYKNLKTGNYVYTRGQAARPFLYPAFKQNQDQIRENVAKAIRAAVKGGNQDD